MSIKQLSLFVLAIAVIAGTTAAITNARRGPLLVPTLDLEGDTVGGSVLLGSATVNGIPLKQFSSSQVENGVTLAKDEHNIFVCPDGGPVVTTAQQSDNATLFWGYEYTGNEVQNKKDGKLGRSLFDGKFFISQGQLNAAPGRYDFLNDLTTLTQGKMYYFMSEADLTLTCAQGIAKASSSSSSSSTSTSISSSTSTSSSTSVSTSSSDSSSVSSSDSSSSSVSSDSSSSDSSVISSSSSAGGPGGNDGGSSDSSSTSSSSDSSSTSDSSDSSGSSEPSSSSDSSVSSSDSSDTSSSDVSSSSDSSDISSSSDSSSSIYVPACGNSILDAGEQCDDGNLIDGDGCFDNCKLMIPPSSI